MSSTADNIEMTAREDGIELSVKVAAGSSRNEIVGIWAGALRVAVTAPPQAGKANKQLVRLLGHAFGTKRGRVAVTHGHTQPLKRVFVAGISVEQARRVLASILDSAD